MLKDILRMQMKENNGEEQNDRINKIKTDAIFEAIGNSITSIILDEIKNKKNIDNVKELDEKVSTPISFAEFAKMMIDEKNQVEEDDNEMYIPFEAMIDNFESGIGIQHEKGKLIFKNSNKSIKFIDEKGATYAYDSDKEILLIEVDGEFKISKINNEILEQGYRLSDETEKKICNFAIRTLKEDKEDKELEKKEQRTYTGTEAINFIKEGKKMKFKVMLGSLEVTGTASLDKELGNLSYTIDQYINGKDSILINAIVNGEWSLA